MAVKAASHNAKDEKKVIEFQIETKAARLVQVNGHISQTMDSGTPPRAQVALKLERLFQLEQSLDVELRRLHLLLHSDADSAVR